MRLLVISNDINQIKNQLKDFLIRQQKDKNNIIEIHKFGYKWNIDKIKQFNVVILDLNVGLNFDKHIIFNLEKLIRILSVSKILIILNSKYVNINYSKHINYKIYFKLVISATKKPLSKYKKIMNINEYSDLKKYISEARQYDIPITKKGNNYKEFYNENILNNGKNNEFITKSIEFLAMKRNKRVISAAINYNNNYLILLPYSKINKIIKLSLLIKIAKHYLLELKRKENINKIKKYIVYLKAGYSTIDKYLLEKFRVNKKEYKLWIDLSENTLSLLYNKKEKRLEPLVMDILQLFLKNPKKYLTYNIIWKKVWKPLYENDENSDIDNIIDENRIMQKIYQIRINTNKNIIETIKKIPGAKGNGYRLNKDLEFCLIIPVFKK